jgi:TRAP-type mannitol/chloroaromatic compound transport system permease small subunit
MAGLRRITTGSDPAAVTTPQNPGDRLAQAIDALCVRVGHAVAWLSLAMVVVTFAVVILRYGFNIGWIAMQESVTWMHAMIFLAGAAYTLQQDGHVRVDIFYDDFRARGKAWVNLLGTLLLLLPTCGFIFYTSWDYVATSWALQEGSRETGGIPAIYLLKSFILLMAALLILQGLAIAWRSLQQLRQPGGNPAP